jgi:hypothetical protein
MSRPPKKAGKPFALLFARLDPVTADAVRAAARADSRTTSGLLRLVILDWLARRQPATLKTDETPRAEENFTGVQRAGQRA